jgi:hypothetical protein
VTAITRTSCLRTKRLWRLLESLTVPASRTKYVRATRTGVLNRDTYVPSLRARACARDPTTVLGVVSFIVAAPLLLIFVCKHYNLVHLLIIVSKYISKLVIKVFKDLILNLQRKTLYKLLILVLVI